MSQCRSVCSLLPAENAHNFTDFQQNCLALSPNSVS